MEVNNDSHWESDLRKIERELGRPLSAEERGQFDRLRPELNCIMAAAKRKAWTLWEYWDAQEKGPITEFTRQLMNRQGTIAPDFNALYEKKAEIERKLSDP